MIIVESGAAKGGIDPVTAGIAVGGSIANTVLSWLDAFGVTQTMSHQQKLSKQQMQAAQYQARAAQYAHLAQAQAAQQQQQTIMYVGIAGAVGLAAWLLLKD